MARFIRMPHAGPQQDDVATAQRTLTVDAAVRRPATEDDGGLNEIVVVRPLAVVVLGPADIYWHAPAAEQRPGPVAMKVVLKHNVTIAVMSILS